MACCFPFVKAARRASAFLEIRTLPAEECESETWQLLPVLEPSQADQKAAAAPGIHIKLPNRVLGSAQGCLVHPSRAGGVLAKLLPIIREKAAGTGQHLGLSAGNLPSLLLLLMNHQITEWFGWERTVKVI